MAESSSQNCPEYLYHYTTVDSLAEILKTKSVRFSSLDSLDDLQEEDALELKNAGQYVFVSCWIDDPAEKIPMWKIYASLEGGVRIRLPSQPFQTYSYMHPSGKCYTKLFSPRELRSMKVMAGGFTEARDHTQHQLFPIKYAKDSKELYPHLLSKEGVDLGSLGRFKNYGWDFQKEWRYRFVLIPFDHDYLDNPDEEFMNQSLRILSDQPMMPISHYDVRLREDAFDQMEITLSPNISTGNRIIVETLVEKFNPKAKIFSSAFSGLIR